MLQTRFLWLTILPLLITSPLSKDTNTTTHKTMKTYEVILISLLSSLLTLVVTLFSVHLFMFAPFKKEAVDRGFASWEVTDNATGQTCFKWNVGVPTDTLDQIEKIDLTKAQ